MIWYIWSRRKCQINHCGVVDSCLHELTEVYQVTKLVIYSQSSMPPNQSLTPNRECLQILWPNLGT
uniref:Uncharacterized protein n=1 Tax=Triticum urartu TaxID=4572 RepID=A0A8R7PSZ1_TRIUA